MEDLTYSWRQIGGIDFICDCPSEDGSWYMRRCTTECKDKFYILYHAWRASEDARREKVPEIVLIADIVDPVLSGQYDRSTALDIAEEILEAQRRSQPFA